MLRIIAIVSGYGLCAALAIVGGWLALWLGQGGRIVAVQSGSMQPLFSIGDALLISPQPTYKVGDIIQFPSQIDHGTSVSHRVTAKQGRWLTTKGDALNKSDGRIDTHQVKGRVVAVLPGFGHVLDQLHQLSTLLPIIYIPALILVINEAWLLARQFVQPYRLAGYRP